jgi:hypothetical protein
MFPYIALGAVFIVAIIALAVVSNAIEQSNEVRKSMIEFRHEELKYKQSALDAMTSAFNDDDDDGPDLSDIFNRPAPDPSIIGKH